MIGFAGRTAIVTGAASGIGHAVAVDLTRRGVTVTGVDVADATAQGLGLATYVRGDVSDPTTADRAVHDALAAGTGGNVDMLVNAAGVAWFDDPGLPTPPHRDGSILDLDLTTWDRVIAINLTGTMLFARAVLPVMRDQGYGAMVHVASIAGLRTADGALDAYQVSKAGVVSLSRAIAAQHGSEGVRSNTVCPGAIVTPMIAGIYEADPARAKSMAARVPLRRTGQPRDVSAAVAYLLSDGADFVTGTDLVVDGGWLTNMG